MALNNLIAKIWSAQLLVNLHKKQVYGQVVNRDYEGEIRNGGDRVQIPAIGAVTISSYTKYTDLSTPQQLDAGTTTLVVDQQKSYNFAIDDIDKAFQTPKIAADAIKEAAYGLANDFDTYIAGLYTDAALTTGLGTDGTPLVVSTVSTDTNAYELLVDMGNILDENNVPDEQRWVVIPPWMFSLLLKDERFVSFGTPANRATAAQGMLGDIAGFTVYRSNNVSNTSGAKYKVLAGYPGSITAANAVVKMEAFRSPTQFTDVVRGLHVYGAKVVRPSALACATISKS